MQESTQRKQPKKIESKQPKKYQFSLKRQFKVFFSLWRIDDLKPRIEVINTWQVYWTEKVELNRANFTNVVIFNNENFWLFTFDCCNFSSTTYVLSLFEKTIKVLKTLN